MSNNKKLCTKFEIAKTENEECIKIKFNEYKDETYRSICMKLLTLD